MVQHLTPDVPPQSNTRALAIFTIYISTCTLLTLYIVYLITKAYSGHLSGHLRPRIPRTRFATFTSLALLSLSVTWYYMIQFFALSYRSWAFAHAVPLPQLSLTLSDLNISTVGAWLTDVRLGEWLKDVQLFREAWETALENKTRLCWSLPIFGITASWSFWITKEANSRRIKHTWVYMVLGQLVAISFAMNLFFLAVLVHPSARQSKAAAKQANVPTSPKGRKNSDEAKDRFSISLWTPPRFMHSALGSLTWFGIGATIVSTGQRHFLWCLAAPHVVLLLPPILHIIVPQRLGTFRSTKAAYDNFYSDIIAAMSWVGLLVWSCILGYTLLSEMSDTRHSHRHSNVYRYPWQAGQVVSKESPVQNLWRTLLDHPAVTSVGCDSILCIVSMLIWIRA